MWLLSVSTATGAAALAVPGMPPTLSLGAPPANTGLFITGSEESIIWFDSDSVFADGATFSLLPSPVSMSAQSILKRVTLGHVAKMFRCSCCQRTDTQVHFKDNYNKNQSFYRHQAQLKIIYPASYQVTERNNDQSGHAVR